MTSLPNHRDFIDAVTPSDLRRYPQGLGIVISKIKQQTHAALDQDEKLSSFLDLLLLNNKGGLNNFFTSLGEDTEDGISVKQLQLISSLYRITAGYSAPRELGESSELSTQQLYTLSSEFFQNVLVFLSENILQPDTNERLKITAIQTISEYVQYILKLVDKAYKERERIISQSNAQKRNIEENESSLLGVLKSLIKGKGYIDELKRNVDLNFSPELSKNSDTLYQLAGRLGLIDELLDKHGYEGIRQLDIPSSFKSTLDRIMK